MIKTDDLFRLQEHLLKVGRYSVPKDLQFILDELIVGARERALTIEAGQVFYRARKIDGFSSGSDEGELFELKEMGAPPISLSKPSRVMPEGIPCLYLSSNKLTAASEVRPWNGVIVQVAAFEVKKKSVVVDLTQDLSSLFEKPRGISLKEIMEEKGNEAWVSLNMIYSKPIDGASHLEYSFTQFIADLFKVHCKMDGIKYRSSASSNRGFNLALFDPDKAQITKPEEMEIRRVDQIYLDFQKVGGPIVKDLKSGRAFDKF